MKTQKYVGWGNLFCKLMLLRSRASLSCSSQEMPEVTSKLDVLPPRPLTFMLAVYNRIPRR